MNAEKKMENLAREIADYKTGLSEARSNAKEAFEAYQNGDTFDGVIKANRDMGYFKRKMEESIEQAREIKSAMRGVQYSKEEADENIQAFFEGVPEPKTLGERLSEFMAKAEKKISAVFNKISDKVADDSPAIGGYTVLGGAAAIFGILAASAAIMNPFGIAVVAAAGVTTALIGIGTLAYSHSEKTTETHPLVDATRNLLGGLGKMVDAGFATLSGAFKRHKIQKTLEDFGMSIEQGKTSQETTQTTLDNFSTQTE